MSLKLQFIKFCMSLSKPLEMTPDTDYTKQRKMADDMQMSLVKSVQIRPAEYGGVPCELLTPDRVEHDEILFYIHGGGFVNGSAKGSRYYGTVLADEMKMRVVTVSYRLAPENRFPKGQDDCYAVYRELVKDQEVILVGESAGGNLVLTVPLRAKADGIKMPRCIVCMSPCTSLAEDLPSRKKNEGAPGVPQSNIAQMIKDTYLDTDTDPYDPLVSPFYADFTGFPPVYLSADDGEVLFDDTDLLVPKMRGMGVSVKYDRQHGTWHAFGTTGRGCKESRVYLQRTKEFILENL